ncbi:FAD-dependent oxidoreductase [Shewanella inventionis]|uniref:Succinate dehydrogenase/fumarate reductase flavoprotein subunit n=1 Tax=Shewanella inventionis TaxID=1738770 RepID=A0ABQ1JMH6_9GAMM|nr:FAD-binding protein [Shewanella inventionis]MCL1159630.1 FAD-binding protein [Shewanella inventionis]GGB70383.1 succinate dehydrogenase/fumarate reductase flavoprotein subunit [Shewanella inventionis]
MSFNAHLSRRQFIGIAGGIAGAAAFANMGFDAPAQENKPKIDSNNFTVEHHHTDVLVIGGGMAGLFAAVKAHDAGANVMMVSKGRVGSSGLTPFAKGIFSYDKANASVTIDEFVAQVTESAIETNNPVFTRQLAEHSYARVQELTSWGFFDSALYHHSFMKPINERNIPVNERIMITHLLKQDGRVVGASGFSLDELKIVHYHAKSVVLCTGAGGFKPNGFPVSDLTHDGTIMAYKIGAKVTGKEWNDGHPGSAKNSGSSYDNWHGQVEQKPSVTSVTINHHLGVDLNYLAYTQGSPVVMRPPRPEVPGMQRDNNVMAAQQGQNYPAGPYVPPAFRQSGPPPKPPEQGFLRSLVSSKGHSGPPGMGGEQVGGSSAGMAIHKSEGLVPINDQGLSTIPGLYAAGDALGSYMSGGIYTQIGSSLAGSAVQGAIAGAAAANDSLAIQGKQDVSEQYLTFVNQQILAPLTRKRGYSPAWVTQVLQGVMIPNFVLYIKKERMMQAALAYVEELYEHHVPMLMADDLHALRLAHETENMIITAEMKLKASIMRKESRCSHYRLDCPDIDYENWQAWINIYKDDAGNMVLEKQPFKSWPNF